MTQFFSQLPVHDLINDSQKKRYVHQLGSMTYFLATQNLTQFCEIWEIQLATHLQSFLCVPQLMTRPQKKLRVSTMTHDLFFDNTKFDLISIFA